ncbi:endonuclease domain-containing protein [Mycobacterium sp. pV006]|uniref:endonuclease domain-containing protein n=1 Tax=Mycobacterium sp. pV006 TaxID=3238983 RepID=UPI00351AF3B6
MRELIVASEALAGGTVTRQDLRRRFVKLHRNVYAPQGMPLTARDRAVAAWLWSGRRATLAGMSAAAMHGSRWLPADGTAELTRVRCGSPPGIAIHRETLLDDEVCLVQSIDCTSVARTAFDLGRRIPGDEAIIRIDALLNATRCPSTEIDDVAVRHPGMRGIRRLRAVLSLVDGGAESPQETRVRLLLVRNGLPRPVTQIPVRNAHGRVVRRIDMGWPGYLVGVEYDGEQHWTDPAAHADDIARLEFLAARGWIIVRVSARHLRYAPDGIVRRAEEALRARGWDGSL